jgi:hypothetical protein
MSWTQGIQVREECSEKQVKNLDKIGEIKFGPGYKFMAFVWDDVEPGVMNLDFQNEEGDYRSLVYRYPQPTNE